MRGEVQGGEVRWKGKVGVAKEGCAVRHRPPAQRQTARHAWRATIEIT